MSDTSDANLEQNAYLTSLRKELASYLAQKLTFSLFQAGKSAELKQRITDLVEEKLLADEIPLESAQKEKVIKEIMDGMPTLQNDEVVAAKDVKDSDKLSLEELQDIIRPFLAASLDDSLFSDDRKSDLLEAIETHVDEKIKMDDIPVPEGQRRELINTICSTMGLDPADISAATSEVPSPTPDTPKLPPQPPAVALKEEGASPEAVPSFKPAAPIPDPAPAIEAAPKQEAPAAALPKKKIPKPSAGSMLPLKALTHEIKRDLLYNLSTQINPEVMASGDELAFRTEIFGLIQKYCTAHKFMLNDQDVEKIVLEILSGEGLEFQL